MPLLGVFLKYISRDMPFITVIPRILSQNLMIFSKKSEFWQKFNSQFYKSHFSHFWTVGSITLSLSFKKSHMRLSGGF